MPRISILAATSIGGAEKAATIYAVGLARRGWEVDYLADSGPRARFLTENGVRLVDAASDPRSLREYLENARPAVVHQHVPGYPSRNPLYPALDALSAGAPRPKIIETNIFGRLEDPRHERFIDFRAFISAASAAQAFRRARLSASEALLRRQTVIYYPIAPAAALDDPSRRAFREELGIADGEVLAVRVGRASHKWAAWEAQAFALAHRLDPPWAARTRLFLMEPDAPLRQRIEAGHYGSGIIVRPVTADFAWIEKLYSAADLMIHASDWGESFGYTIAEAMAAGLPVITRSTPWGDNAQVELVANGQTGFVCWSVPEMARRLLDLVRDPGLRGQMGGAGRARILSLANLEREIDVLTEAIRFVQTGETGAKLAARTRVSLKFIEDFAARERQTSEAAKGLRRWDQLAASLHAAYRGGRSGGRALLNRWQRR